jgi:FkbM family methyltransferase
MPSITVVMPVYNGAPFVRRAVASLAAQTFADWELLAVDDASADGSVAILEELAADPRVRVLRHPANRGPAAARNTALAAAGGELVAYLDCDDEFYPDHLARAHDHRGRADVLLFRYDLVEERPGHPGFSGVSTYDPAARRDFLFAETIAVPLGVVHRRSLLDRVGGFDERLWRDEDGDLWRRFARAGATFTAVPHRSGRYHVRADSLARTGPPPAARPAGPGGFVGGLPTPVVSVELRVRGERYSVQIPGGEAGTVPQVFERHEYGGVRPGWLRTRPTVIDVGANVGTFALYAVLALGASAVHCFEPYPPTVELLRRNVAPFPGMAVHPFGLGPADAEADLLIDPRCAVCNSLCPELVPSPAARVRVPIRDAGAAWDELGLEEVDVLKLDAEGAEVGILGALGPRLGQTRVVMVEYHAPDDRRRIDALLSGHVLFGASVHDLHLGVVKYVRADLAR